MIGGCGGGGSNDDSGEVVVRIGWGELGGRYNDG